MEGEVCTSPRTVPPPGGRGASEVAQMTLMTGIGFVFSRLTVDNKVREGIGIQPRRILDAKVQSCNFFQEERGSGMFPMGGG